MMRLFRFDLLLCVFGLHAWHTYCRSSTAERDTKRDCCRCGFTQERRTASSRWINGRLPGEFIRVYKDLSEIEDRIVLLPAKDYDTDAPV